MKLPLLLLPLLLLLLLPLLTASTTTKTSTTTTTKNECTANIDVYNSHDTASAGITELGIKLLRKLGWQNNTLISPYSIWSVLAMVLVGAEGNTKTEMANVLGLMDKTGALSLWRILDQSLNKTVNASDNKVLLDLANRIYIQQGFSIKKCQTELSNLLVPLDLAQPIPASNTINKFVNTSTRGLIPEIITPDQLGGNTHMVLVNAVYFRGKWKNPFPKSETSRKPFYVTPEADPVYVDTMFMSELPVMLAYSQDIHAQIVQLPYGKGLVSMSILLPLDAGKAGFNATLNALNKTSLWRALNSVEGTTIDVQMPKFEIKSKFAEELKKALNTLGMKDVFTLSANLSSFHESLFVKHVMHKTFLKVDEEGAEAGAATGVDIVSKISSRINIDRPFLFLINTIDTILFIGAYVKP